MTTPVVEPVEKFIRVALGKTCVGGAGGKVGKEVGKGAAVVGGIAVGGMGDGAWAVSA